MLSYLSLSILLKEVFGNVEWKNVLKELVGMPPGLIHVLQLLLGLLLPEEVQGRGDLHLPTVVQDHHHEEAQDEAESENHPSIYATFQEDGWPTSDICH